MSEYKIEKGYSVGINDELKALWISRIIDALKFVVSICEKYNLKYFGCAGTVIGAVRHNGIIPWDDDIDVMMPRKDYEQFIALVEAAHNDFFSVITPENNIRYYLSFAKVFDKRTTLLERKDHRCLIGSYIDIFPIDGCPNDDSQTKILYEKYHKYQGWWNVTVTFWNSHDYIKNFFNLRWKSLAKHIYCHFFKQRVRKMAFNGMHKIESMYDYDTSKKVITWCGQNKCEKEIHRRSWMGDGVKMEFEGMMINIPSNYDAYLKCMFGDYMKLPPKEEQVSHHYVSYLNLEKRETIEEVLIKLKHKK